MRHEPDSAELETGRLGGITIEKLKKNNLESIVMTQRVFTEAQ